MKFSLKTSLLIAAMAIIGYIAWRKHQETKNQIPESKEG